MAAFAVDIGRMHAERRQVQSGADAATLALAHDCAAGGVCDTSTTGVSRTMANSNAKDSQTQVTLVCGGGPGLVACPPQTGVALAQCPPVPSGTSSWIRVTTATAEVGGSTILPSIFAQTMTGGSTGKTVHACAQAAWGNPSGLGAMPVTFSQCEWDKATLGGTSFIHPAPYTVADAPRETKLLLHSTDDSGGCPSGYNGGSYADMPGGFGWLEGTGCYVATKVGDKVPADTGVSGGTCGDVVKDSVNKMIYIPIYSKAEKTGKLYTIAGYAAFYVTGYNLPAVHPKSVDSPYQANSWNCKGSNVCIYGFFTKGLVPSGGTLGSGPAMGASVIALIG
jgi:hypothetical protein